MAARLVLQLVVMGFLLHHAAAGTDHFILQRWWNSIAAAWHPWAAKLAAPVAPAPTPAPAAPAAAAAPRAAAAPTAAPTAVTLGCALPLSGDGAANGLAAQAALHMAAARLAPPGVTVSVRCVDSRCVDVLAHNAVEQLAGDSAVIGIVGDVCSGASVAAAGRANDLGVPVISPTSTASVLTAPDWFFRCGRVPWRRAWFVLSMLAG